MPIKILPEETINKIAAGEVVERPANAVKELIENSLDAKSTAVEIEIKGAGRRLLRVRDNGAGIAPGELKLAVTRHATSKISGFKDLESLISMGFRGEALPSIAAVSNILIQSQLPGASSGWELALSGGKVKKDSSWAGAPGTNIEVADLFFNTPARDKFLKSDATERGRILNTIEELALAAYEVSFKVISEGKTILETPKASDPLERITDVLGRDFASSLIRAQVKHPLVALDVFITKGDKSLSSRNHQFLFVNRRPVNFSKSIMHSVYEACRENLPAGRHPGVVMFIDLDPSEIDVNIHPAKREVRFSKDQQMHHLIYTAIKEALGKAPAAQFGLSGQAPASGTQHSGSVKEPSAPYSYSSAITRSGIYMPPEKVKRDVQPELARRDGSETSKKVVGQIFDLYVIAQEGDGLLIIDQHAAAERIRYEKYLAQWQSKHITFQPLLFPENIELPPSLMSIAAANLGTIREAGLEIAEFGTNTVRITAAPAVLGNNISAANMLKEVLEALSQETALPKPEKIEKIIRAACRSSIKAGDAISQPESLRLVEDLLSCKAPNTCPHGRPTMLRITKAELDRHFGRK